MVGAAGPTDTVPRPAAPPSGRAFRSLANRDYRLYATGSLVSNIGTWMQRTGQDWVVLVQLTHHNATAVGIVTALQFGPQVALLPLTGHAADHLDRRRLLVATQLAMGTIAIALGLLIVTGEVRLWQVYGLALASGCVTAFDAPARQTFIGELVGEAHLSNAVALNSMSFNAGRLIGPGIAGVLIAWLGTGSVFLINAATFGFVLACLAALRPAPREVPAGQARGSSLLAGFRTIAARRDLTTLLAMMFLVGTFGLNFPILVSTMSVKVFHAGPRTYGLLTSTMAVGSVAGALLAARRAAPTIGLVVASAAAFGLACAIAASMPGVVGFALALAAIGITAQTYTTTTISLVQLATPPAMRGRVVAIMFAAALGGAPIGGPAVGWVADRFGPRWALGVAAASGLAAATIGVALLRDRRRRVPREA